MPFSRPTILISLALAAHALSPLALQPLALDCSVFPLYNATTQTAGPWPIVADSTGASIDGGEASIVSFTNDGRDRYGFITLPQPNPSFGALNPSITLRCTNSTLQAQLDTSWVPISIAGDENWQNSLSFGLPEAGISVQPYAHVVNGTRMPGVFLGAEGSTRWFFKHNWGGNAGEYFLLRWVSRNSTRDGERQALQGTVGKRQAGTEPPVVDDRDWYGYLKIAG